MLKRLFFLFFTSISLVSCTKEMIGEFVVSNETIFDSSKPQYSPLEENTVSGLDKTSNWIINMQNSKGLLESSENTNFVSLYDNALAALFFISEGELERAERIFDFFNGKVEAELLNGSGGFYQFRNSIGENGSRTWLGDNAWLLIAINQYRHVSGNNKYNFMATQLENWLRSLQDFDGGLWGGHNEDGGRIPKVTEGIITAFNAVQGYDDFHKNILRYLKNERWDVASNSMIAWPENPEYTYALDLHTLSYMIFEKFPDKTLQESDRYLTTQTLTMSGKEITGYCFDEDKDVIWLEGTAQMAVALNLGGMKKGTDLLLAELEKSLITSTSLGQSNGLPYTSNYGTSYGSANLWDHADITPALSSTIWYLFAKTGFDPLALGRSKNIPDIDSFWTN